MQLENKIFAIVITLLYVITYSSAYSQQIVFNKLNTQSVQITSPIGDFTQDTNGTLWFSTDNGVFSYDGLKLNTYRNNPLDPNSLANNFSISICADNNGMIWIGTVGSGLDMLNPETGKFTHFINDPNDTTSLSNNLVADILMDKDGTLWIGTHGGLDKYDSETNSFIHYKHNPTDSTSISSNQVRVIYEDNEGVLWIGTGSPWPNDVEGPDDGGLNRMNKKTGTFTRYKHDPNNDQSLINNKVSAIFEDSEGTFWIGTGNKGIQKMIREKGTFEPVFSESEVPELFVDHEMTNTGLVDDYITFFKQDVTGKLWFGTVASGLYNYNLVNRKIVYYDATDNSSSGYSDNGGRSAFITRDNILWIGSAGGNLYYTDPSIKKIQHTSLTGESIGSFYEEPNGDFWIGTRREIIRVIKNSGLTKKYTTDDYRYDAPNTLGYLVYGDKKGNIWVGTTESLNRFDKKTEKFIAYKHDPENENSISDNYAITVYEDSKSNFWIGTLYGLNLMDRETGTFKQFYVNPEVIKDANRDIVTSITEDKSGKLWVGYYNNEGVKLFNPDNEDFKSYLKNTTILALHVDFNGVLWAGTSSGLYKYNANIDNFIPFTTPGVAVNIPLVYSIVEDDKNNLWLTTSNQIVKINSERNEASFFGQNYGIGQNDFNILSGYIKSNNEIYFGNANGYFSFFPDELIKSLNTPELIFTGLNISNSFIKPGDGGPLYENINTQQQINLRYNQNVFSIDFTIADYANPAQNSLTYYLENYDIEWRSVNTQRKAYYFNVPPGKYVFHLKGVNSYGAWNEKTIDIIIKPPWYKTWLAYGIYVLLFIVIVFAFDRIMRRRIVQKERLKTQERELAQAKEIEKAYKDLKATQTQLIQSEKMASLGELTAGIAHEIQNPLNFVNNFSEVNNELLDDLKEAIVKNDQTEIESILKDLKENESKVTIHGKRAESIVKGMLLHSRGSSGQKEPTDINALCDEYLRLSYHGFRAKDKSFNADFKLEADESLPKINVVPQDIGRVILNLVNNAFFAVNEKVKQTGNSFKPLVVITTTANENNIKITVSDNGNGIPDSVKSKIFQPFFTTKPTGQGTGLGLSLSYDIIKAHGGELFVESTINEGTEFKIVIPY